MCWPAARCCTTAMRSPPLPPPPRRRRRPRRRDRGRVRALAGRARHRRGHGRRRATRQRAELPEVRRPIGSIEHRHPHAPRARRRRRRHGGSRHRDRARIRLPHVHQGYIEPHACVVDTGADGKANVWASSQGHFMVRAITAAVLDWETSRIKVTPAEIGGGFGGKTTVYLEPVAARLSEKAGRPVKLVMSREEVLRSSGPAPGAKLRIKIGATSDGELTAIDGWMAYQVGAYGDFAGMVGAMSVASYKFPNLKLESWGVLSNTPKTAAYAHRRPRTPPLPSSRSSTTSQASSAWTRSNCDSRMPQSRVTSRRWACPIRVSASSNASKRSRPAITTSPSRSRVPLAVSPSGSGSTSVSSRRRRSTSTRMAPPR